MSKLSKFRVQARNANKHTPRGLGMLEKSIRADGWIGALTVAADGETFDGSARLEVVADVLANADPIVVDADGTRPVIVRRTDIPNADDDRAKRLGLAANRIQQVDYAPDADVLASLAGEIDLGEFWTKDELADLLKDTAGNDAEDPGPQIDRAAELQAKWGTSLNQLWQIGRHRLLVGDCTVAENVARLMGGEKAALVVTSPPYAQQRDYSEKVTDWFALMAGMSKCLPIADGGQVLVNLGLIHRDGEWVPYWDEWIDWMRANGWLRFGWYVWDKLNGMPGDYHGRLWPSHEWIFHFVPVASKHAGEVMHKTVASKHAGKVPKVTGNRKADGSFTAWTGAGKAVQSFKVHDSVFRLSPAKGGVDGHPAPFPVELPLEIIPIFSDDDAIVYEPFTGSGTTLVACEKLGRIGRGMELSPAYAAVTLERLVGLGLTAELVS